MGSYAGVVTHEFPPYFRVYNDGHVERLKVPADYSPPSVDPQTGVESKDVVISEETGVKARIFLPKINCLDQTKLPLLVHYHGGAFCVGSSLDTVTTRLLNLQTSVANVVTVSVDYRLAPEHPLPIAYDDSWSALQWIATHLNGEGPELWLNEYVDFGRVFLTGDSVGANIAQHMAVRVGIMGGPLDGFRVRGAVMVHPFFGVSEPDKMIQYLYPGSSGTDSDPRLNPKADPDLGKMGCEKVLVFVAEKDWFKARGVEYCETLKKSEWKGTVELVEHEGENHVFHVPNPTCEKALLLMHKLASFVNQG